MNLLIDTSVPGVEIGYICQGWKLDTSARGGNWIHLPGVKIGYVCQGQKLDTSARGGN